MTLTLASKLKLAAAAAVLAGGVAAAALQPLSTGKAALNQALKDDAERGDYGTAAWRARAYIDAHPREVEVYGTWIAALALGNRVDEARKALEAGKRAFPELVQQYAQPVSEAIDKIEAGHQAYAEAEGAVARGLPGLAARKYAEAYDALLQDPRVGLKSARAWAAVDEPVKAALILRKLADKGDPAVVREAKAFWDSHKGTLGAAAVEASDEGWKILDGLGTDDAPAAKAKEAFERAVTLQPDHANLKPFGVDAMRSPYVGLAMAAAISSPWDVRSILTKGAANGLPAPFGTLEGRAGTALGVALCDEDNAKPLDDAYGERAKAWAAAACERSRADKDWRDAVDAFDKANARGVAPDDALSGFEEAKGLFARDWDGRFPAAAYVRRTECNIAFLQAWQIAFAPAVDHADLDKAMAASTACPTDDFSRKKLTDRVASVRDGAVKRDAFAFKVCNRSSADRVRIAYMRGKPGEENELLAKGWWDLDKGKCLDLPASFAGADEADLYLTAHSDDVTWWPVDTAAASACLGAGKVERTSEPGEVACSLGEDLHGFLKLTARRKPGKSGLTYTIKDPA